MHNEEQRMVARPLKTIGERLESEDHLRDANEPRARQGLTAQKWAEESADRYRDLVEGLDAIVWEANVDPWQYTFVSQRAQVLFGYPVERWLREPRFWTDLSGEPHFQSLRACRMCAVRLSPALQES